MEGAGTVESVGERVIDWNPGDRVAWAMTTGSYAEYARFRNPSSSECLTV